MLDYKKDRIDYGRQLNPPDGFRMERAVATTYSLDLFAFLSIPVALFYKKNLDGKVSENRMDIFDAIQKTSDRITVYCQKGKIKVPYSANRIVSFIDQSIAEVLPDSAFIAFHPKIWVIRYVNPTQKILYRVIILSRNLTFDRSWDVAFTLNGFVTKHQVAESKPLATFIRHLSSFKDFAGSETFIEDLGKTRFTSEPLFHSFRFHPTGFVPYTNPLAKTKWKDLTIVSPFLDQNALEHFLQAADGKKCLFSRKEELDKIHMSVLKKFHSCYALSQDIVEGEDFSNTQEESDDLPSKQNLHAKIFLGETPEGQTRWFIGSGNCSTPALERNHEFLVELLHEKAETPTKMITEALVGKDKNFQFFEDYTRKQANPIKTDEYDFRKVVYSILKYLEHKENLQVECRLRDETHDTYNILISLKPHTAFNKPDLVHSIAPYGWNAAPLPILTDSTMLYENIPVYNLSPFFIWKINNTKLDQEKSFITKLPVALPEHRKQAIFKSIIQDKQRFIQLIQFLLGSNDDIVFFRDLKEKHQAGKRRDNKLLNISANMYEEMLIAASRDPAKLKDIDNLIRKLEESKSEDLIPEEFHLLWKVFKQIVSDA